MAKALTAASVDKIKPDPKGRREIPDGLLSGLYLVVQPTGAKSWAVRYRYGGDPRKLTVGSYPALELGEAREAARLALQRVQKGGDPSVDKKLERRRAGEAASDDFDAVARKFLDRYQKPKNRSWKEAARLLGLVPDREKPDASDDPKRFVAVKGGLVAKWGDRKIGDIRKSDIIAVLDDTFDRAPIQANRQLAALRKMFNWALERDLITASPCAGVKPPAAEVSRDRVLSDGELVAVWKAAGTIGWPFGPIVQILALTGQRRDEVAGMAWSELDLEKKLWTLPRGRVKTDAGHEVPLSAAAVEIIKNLPRIDGRDLVFTTTGESPVSGFSKIKERLDAISGVSEWRIHDLRRTVASGLARLGIALPVIEKALNHTSGTFKGVVGVYQRHGFADEKRAALETWGRAVSALIEGKPANVVELATARA